MSSSLAVGQFAENRPKLRRTIFFSSSCVQAGRLSRTILNFVNDLCAGRAAKLSIFFAKNFFQGIAKELNYEIVNVSKPKIN